MLLKFLSFISGCNTVLAMVGYRLSLRILVRLCIDRLLKKDYLYQPTVTVMVAAHNEENVIYNKLNNIKALLFEGN